MFEPPLLGKHAVAAALRHLALEIGLVAKQAKAVFHLPLDAKVAGARELRNGGVAGRKAGPEADEECENEGSAHD